MSAQESVLRFIAFYLPQFHPIKENDEWWGKGFTEWTNTGKARRRFIGHYQPHVPADLGYYDLRVPEVRVAQAELARSYGIEGFCYYHYWFGDGRRLLEKPFQEVLASSQPDYPFCLCWANDTWTGIWHGAPDRTLIEQKYPGAHDDEAHFAALLPAFRDKRYIRIDGKPIFIVWRPFGFPNPLATVNRWRLMAKEAGLPGLYLVGIFRPGGGQPEDYGFNASVHNDNPQLRPWGTWKNPMKLAYYALQRKLGIPTVYSYKKAIDTFLPKQMPDTRYPSVIHSWDNTPRSGVNGLVLKDSSPELFRVALRRAIEIIKDRHPQNKIIFLKSWNEWAEGNHLEPDLRDGHAYLQVILDEYLNNSVGC